MSIVSKAKDTASKGAKKAVEVARNIRTEDIVKKSRVEKLSRSQLIGFGIVLAIVLFLAGNMLAGNLFRSSRVDLTDNNLYSLSKGTRTLLAKLKEPIHLRLFLSKGLVQQAPQLAAYATRVQSMLEAYADLSGGKITLEVIDPKPYSDDEDRAVGLGINRIRLQGAPNEVFFGLAATNSTDGKGKIPVFSPRREAHLEYDLTRLVAELGQPKKPVIAVIDGVALSGNPMARQPQSILMTQLKELYKVEQLHGDVDKLPEGTRVLVIAHPKGLSDRTLYTIDQWVLNGGATMVFVDPYAETQPTLRPGMPPRNPQSQFDKLFSAWGVKFDTKKSVGDPKYALQTQRRVGGRIEAVTFLPWLALRKDSFDTQSPLLANLSSIVMTQAGAFTAVSKDVKLVPLITGSKEAGLLPTAIAARPTSDPRALLGQLDKKNGPPIIAARLEGKIKSAFPKGKPEKSEHKGTPLKALKGTLNVMLVGDADMLSDRNWIRRQQGALGQRVVEAFANNGPFVLNAVEQMSGGTVLADLRGRGVSWRPFEKIKQLERNAEAQYLTEQQRLMQKLRAAEAKLRQISQQNGKDGELVSAESEKAVNQFRQELLATRAQLRQVQFNLRRDVDGLKSWITTLNVGLIPVLVGALALFMAFRRQKTPMPDKPQPQTTETTV